MQPSIFKSYDIRALSPGEIEISDAERIGRTLGAIYKPKRVIVGHDMRTTSQELEEALIEGLRSQGADIVRIGLCSTPMFYFAMTEARESVDLGVMVTASHNPSEYNGFKMMLGNGLPIGQGSGMEDIRDMACSEMPIPHAAQTGSVTDDEHVLEHYIEKMWQLSGLAGDFSDLRIAVDAGNGMNGHTLPKLLGRLHGAHIEKLYWDLDGRFPNHEANPVKTETLDALRAVMKKHQCHVGFAFDGDGDRIGVVDEEGTPIPGDMLGALLSQEILRDHLQATILYDLRSSSSLPELITSLGGTAKMCRVGHAHIKKQLIEENAAFASELSMHFYFGDLRGSEATDLVLLLVLKFMQREGKPLSQLWKPLKKYAHSGEINFKVADTQATIERIQEHFVSKAKDIITIDGVRMNFEGWWFSVRASNTEPLLRLNLEAKTVEEMEAHKKELTDLIY
ncbi:MAG: phosphomannomutase/phosphoglucomutase [Candidatus Nomurabacteria bacterium]|nr:MAG: phosphomannomutase/phosphoglucomutase [Candidatus Nomurabacteria bacterium]